MQMTFDRDDSLKNTYDGTVSGSGLTEVVESESLVDTTPGEPNEFGDFGTLRRLFKKSADIRSKLKGVSCCVVVYPSSLVHISLSVPFLLWF